MNGNGLKQKLQSYSPNVIFFIVSFFISGVVSTALQGTFHNYLNDVFAIDADQRGWLEFPRELPGLLAVFIIGSLFFLGEIKVLAIAILVNGIGLLGLGYFSFNYTYMIFFMMLWSMGMHIHMSLWEPVAMDLSRAQKKGTVLGKLNAIRSFGIIIGTILIWFFMGKMKLSYANMYLGGFVLCVLAAIFYSRIRLDQKRKKKAKFTFIFKKKYTLFYLLACAFGVRKQLFLVFAPWLLIKFFHQRPQDLAKLLFLSAVLGIIIKPYLGILIDRFGERRVLFIDAALILLLSGMYVIVPGLTLPWHWALIILYACYILDELLFSLRTARTTYLFKIVEHPSDLTPTISMGISIEHIVSMIVPIAAGIVWMTYGYQWVFLMTCIMAVFSGGLALAIPKSITDMKRQPVDS